MTTNAILLTVWHTGTHYFLKGLESHYDRASYSHLNDRWEAKTQDHDVYTTKRDVYQIGASWANRNHFTVPNGNTQWFLQWRTYRDLLKTNAKVLDLAGDRTQYGIEFPNKPLNAFDDRYGLHKALKAGDWDTYYKKVPRHYIEFAQEMVSQ